MISRLNIRFLLVAGTLLILLLQQNGQFAYAQDGAEPCPASGVWPPGCTPRPSPSQPAPPTEGRIPCPASGVWPAGCDPNLPPETNTPPPSTEGVPCPASGVWPVGCNPNLPPETNTPPPSTGGVPCPASGVWPAGCNPNPPPSTTPPSTTEEIVLEMATKTILALKAQDMETVAALVHPTAGLRFSPYAFVSDGDLLFTAEQVATLMSDPAVYNWGSFDAVGGPIEMTFAQYYDRFVYDQDFANAEQIGVNETIGSGTMFDNSAQFYPNAFVIEYHFSGFDPDFAGLDWKSLRLVFQETADSWALVGIIHAEWTT